jgi:signal transduction histidine kinase
MGKRLSVCCRCLELVMRRLYLSIVFMVLASLFFLGWTLDKLEAVDDSEVKEVEYALYYKLMRGFSLQTLSLSEQELQVQVPRWATQFSLPLSLHDGSELALPLELQKQLFSLEGLLLESEQQTYLIKSLSAHPQYQLYLTLPEVEAGTALDLWLTIAFYLGAGLLMALWLLPLTRRLSLIHRMATEFGKGKFESRIPMSRFSYIHWLEKSFNRMAQKIEELIEENRILASGLSHDLRTPLACLRFGLEAALEVKGESQKNNMMLRMESDLAQMEEMVSAFLGFASLEKQRAKLNIKAYPINLLFIDIERQAKLLAEQENIVINFRNSDISKELAVDKLWFSRILLNIIANAVRFSRSHIDVNVTVDNEFITVIVEDDGPGIAPEEWKNAFKPFVRLESTRNRDHGNYGLGLTIAKKVIEWHQGNILITMPTTLNGCCFKLIFKDSH